MCRTTVEGAAQELKAMNVADKTVLITVRCLCFI